MKSRSEKQRVVFRVTELPTHAYHPNASLRKNARPAYISWPIGGDDRES